MAPAKSTKKASKTVSKYVVDYSNAASIFDEEGFVTFLNTKIKVDGRTGNLGDLITVTKEGDSKIAVTSHTDFSGRYLKYLTKKYLKKTNFRDWLRVVSVSKGVYELRYFNVAVSDDEEEDDDE
ncbi:60S ribosomal protein eL22 [Kockiozyma suomiensis]|uniref:60S ribosomal protein eL22 n=1 Tax=Kockiozyma suomiensis TaxID=1337062 RepID=UPI003343FB5F